MWGAYKMTKEKYLKASRRLLISVIVLFLMCGCTSEEITTSVAETEVQTTQVTSEQVEDSESLEEQLESEENLDLSVAGQEVTSEEDTKEEVALEESTIGYLVEDDILTYNNQEYIIIEVDGGDRSGDRENSVAVDIGFGDRIYWGLTNEFGQLVYVLADEIILQDDENEEVNSSGRYYSDEADVPGTELENLDQGHIIADSLGGVANAYNITPQDSTLNRYGDQAYMEQIIRDVGGSTNFVATITYADENTQIPSSYRYEYTLNGTAVIDEFENGNPEDNMVDDDIVEEQITLDTTDSSDEDVSQVDANGNGTVTIQEAKDAGYVMPITSEHWLYQYMKDADGDGMVGE